jgi:hypothetical protein
MADTCKLTMLLPRQLAWTLPQGLHQPCLHGCLLTVGPGGLITVTGPSRHQVFAQIDRFLRTLIRKNPPPATSIAAILTSPLGSDGWQIIVNAEISFAPTGIEATIFPAEQTTGNVVRLGDGKAR